LDCTIPDEGLVRERPNSWNSDGPLVLWENLGFEKERVRADGSINPLLQRLGTWEPAGNATVLPEFDYALRLNLHPDYTLKATLVSPENQIIPLRQRGSSSEN
jgi:hypothetical protein